VAMRWNPPARSRAHRQQVRLVVVVHADEGRPPLLHAAAHREPASLCDTRRRNSSSPRHPPPGRPSFRPEMVSTPGTARTEKPGSSRRRRRPGSSVNPISPACAPACHLGRHLRERHAGGLLEIGTVSERESDLEDVTRSSLMAYCHVHQADDSTPAEKSGACRSADGLEVGFPGI